MLPLSLSQTLSQKPIYFCYSAAHVELGACLTDYSRLELAPVGECAAVR